jgi:hypothetical protein
MSYKAATQQLHFRAQEGSSSVRGTQRGYGGKAMFGESLRILPTLYEQFQTISARIKELQALIAAAPTYEEAERLRSEMGAKVGQHGNMRKIIYEGTRLAFEHCFIQVCKARLPEDLYLELIAEAKDHWRGKGYDKFVPPLTRQERRRASIKLARRDWNRGTKS